MAALTDEQIELLIDLDQQVPCQQDNTAPAEWRMRFDFPCPHKNILFCTHHKEWALNGGDTGVNEWYCGDCDPMVYHRGKLTSVQPWG